MDYDNIGYYFGLAFCLILAGIVSLVSIWFFSGEPREENEGDTSDVQTNIGTNLAYKKL